MKKINNDIYYSLQYILVIFASACAVFSQLPQVTANSTLKAIITFIPWLIVFGYMVLVTRRIYYTDLIVFISPAIIIGYFVLGTALNLLYNQAIVRAIAISMFILFIGLLMGKNVEKEHFYIVLRAYVISTLVFGLYYYIVIFGSALLTHMENVTQQEGKNAIPMLFCNSIVILLFTKKVFPLIKYFLVAFYAFLIILFGSRMVMLATFLMIIARLFLSERGLKDKLVYGLIFGVVFYLLYNNEVFYDTAINRVFLKGQEVNDESMYIITSGRNAQFEFFSSDFKKSWFVGGVSPAFIESFYPFFILSYGVVGMAIISILLLSPLYYAYKYKFLKDDKDLRILLIAILIAFLINAAGEALTPFGPGVKCFMLWLIFGYYLGYSKRKIEVKRYESINNNTGV